jgi:hypothetical protein
MRVAFFCSPFMDEKEGVLDGYTVYFLQEFININNPKARCLCAEAAGDHPSVSNVPHLIVQVVPLAQGGTCFCMLFLLLG